MEFNKSITRTILDWTDKKFEEVENGESKHPYATSFALGAIEGAIDGVVVSYPIILAGCYIWKKKALNK